MYKSVYYLQSIKVSRILKSIITLFVYNASAVVAQAGADELSEFRQKNRVRFSPRLRESHYNRKDIAAIAIHTCRRKNNQFS
jgi:hypothetical protein